MDSKTLEALKDSIEHWRELENAPFEHATFRIGPSNCALCKLYHRRYTAPDDEFADTCVGCPVSYNTKQDFCQGSPYDDASRVIHHPMSWETYEERVAAWPQAAKAEREFLESLLPKEAS